MKGNENYIIKRLNSSHRKKVLEHFFRLDSDSIYSRFCALLGRVAIENYVSKINFDKDGIFGIFDDELNIIGVGECVVDGTRNNAEVGFSVEKSHQNKGLGGKLMERIVRFAKLRGKDHLEMLCLRTNEKSVHLAKKFGLKIKNNTGGDTLAVIDMPEGISVAEHIVERVDENFAEYWLRQRENFNNWKNFQVKYNEFSQKCFIDLIKSFIPKLNR